jgi:hypothetical protein
MPGLVPGIQVFTLGMKKVVDGRNKSGHDGGECRVRLLPLKIKKQLSAPLPSQRAMR